MLETIKKETAKAVEELIEVAKLKEGSVLVIGCSSSEICGDKIGTSSVPETAECVFNTAQQILKEKGIRLAAQCCEHLNRAIIIEANTAKELGLETVNVVPQVKAGGSFATAAYNGFDNAVAVENIKADAGLDIGDTLIGMHLKSVAVPVRLSIKSIGKAHITAARVRPKFIGGIRAVYDENLM